MKVFKILSIIFKILLSILCIGVFLLCALPFIYYYLGGLGYIYYAPSVERDFNIAVAVCAVALVLLIVLIVMMCKAKRIVAKIITTVLLIASVIVNLPLGSFGYALLVVSGVNGYSYTEDIANYGVYDRDYYKMDYFPESISEDMEVVKFAYFASCETGAWRHDIYLEVKFENAEDMTRYLSDAKASFLPNEAIEYESPFNPQYTDIMIWKMNKNNNKWYLYDNYISFGCNRNKYTDMDYSCISYSYDELTVIYSDTYVTLDIPIGNNLDDGAYYPKILERFGVEWKDGYSFNSSNVTKGRQQ